MGSRSQDWIESKWALPSFAFAFAFLSGVLDVAYKSLDFVARGYPHQLLMVIMEEGTGRLGLAFVLPLTILFLRRLPLRRDAWARSVAVHIGMSLVLSFFETSFMWASRSVISPMLGLGLYDYGIMPVRYPMEYPKFLFYYVFIVTLLTMWDWHKSRAQLEAQLAQAQLQNLRLQLQPHFLFNALNMISSVMYENPRVADEMIARLSDLLRRTLSESRAQEVPLEQ